MAVIQLQCLICPSWAVPTQNDAKHSLVRPVGNKCSIIFHTIMCLWDKALLDNGSHGNKILPLTTCSIYHLLLWPVTEHAVIRDVVMMKLALAWSSKKERNKE